MNLNFRTQGKKLKNRELASNRKFSNLHTENLLKMRNFKIPIKDRGTPIY